MVAGAVLAGTCVGRRQPPGSTPDRRVCAYMDAIMAAAFLGISPPPGGTPEDFAATLRANAGLAQMREQLRGSDLMKEAGCG